MNDRKAKVDLALLYYSVGNYTILRDEVFRLGGIISACGLFGWLAWCYNNNCSICETEYWCGCDGKGMAHKAGAKGFDCEVK